MAAPTPPLSFGDASIADQSYNKDAAIATLNLPAATGGSGAIAYSLSPSLPAGLSFDASARTISGTPTEAATGATYRYSATDGTDTVMLSFSIEVTAAEEGASGPERPLLGHRAAYLAGMDAGRGRQRDAAGGHRL